MRISMVYTNRNPYLCPAPVGALLVTARLKQDGHEVDFVDLMHARTPRATLISALTAHQPDLVCASIRNVDNQQGDRLDHPLGEVAGYAETIRKVTAAPLLVGGTAVTTFPGPIRRMLGAEYAYAGDDVEPVAHFMASLAEGRPDLDTPGLVYTDHTGSERANPYCIKGYANESFLGVWDPVKLGRYRAKGYFDCGLPTASGCPHGCSFCDAHRTFGRHYMPRDPHQVVDELRELQGRYHAKSVFLINSGINGPLESGKELLSRIIEARLKLSLSCIIEPGPMDDEMARLLYRANVSSAMIFGTTLDDAVLERNQPHYRAADVIRIAHSLARANVPYMLGLMFGGLGESLRGVEDTLEQTLRLKPIMLHTGVGFRIQPDTPLYHEAQAHGLVSRPDDCVTARFYEPPDAPIEQIRQRVRTFSKAHPWHKLRMLGFIARSIKEGILGRR